GDAHRVRAEFEVDVDAGQRERMAQRDEVARALGPHHCGDAGHGQGIALGQTRLGDHLDHLGTGGDEPGRHRPAPSHVLVADVDPTPSAATGSSGPGSSAETHTRWVASPWLWSRWERDPPPNSSPSGPMRPRRICSFPSGGASSNPCASRWYSTSRGGSCPARPSRAGRTNISKLIRVLTGLPGSATQAWSANRPQPCGPPGCMAMGSKTMDESASSSAASLTTSCAPLEMPPVEM